MAVSFDSVTITTAGYIPRYVKHESVADRFLNTMSIAREDGEILISEKYGRKIISMRGTLIGDSQADLESDIDTFTELFSRVEKNLDIDWSSSTRRYVATCTRHNFDRDHFHTGKVPWMAEFVVLSGEGKDLATTTALQTAGVSITTPSTLSFTMAGSKPASAKIRIEGGSWPTSAKGMQFENLDTEEKLTIIDTATGVPGANKFTIYTATKQTSVTLSVTETFLNFYGLMPTFRIGTNNFKITAGDIVNQESGEPAFGTGLGTVITSTSTRLAQSFRVPYADATFQGIKLSLQKTNTPGDLLVRIETDNDGEPSGTLAHANSLFTFTAGGISSAAYYFINSTDLFTLSANTPYWIVINALGVDGSNSYTVRHTETASEQYTKGKYMSSADSGSTWADKDGTMAFKVYYGGKAGSGNAEIIVEYTKTYL